MKSTMCLLKDTLDNVITIGINTFTITSSTSKTLDTNAILI